MSVTQSFLWNKILNVNKEIKETKDALKRWEKTVYLKVLISQLKKDMGEEAYKNLIDSSRKMLTTI
jgi:hypothetical protein